MRRKPRTISGTVVGPDGKPVEGVTINTTKYVKGGPPDVLPLAKSAADGSFTFTLDPPPVTGSPRPAADRGVEDRLRGRLATVRDIGVSPLSLKLTAADVPVKAASRPEGKPVSKRP